MAIRAPKRIIVIALLVMVATGIFGIPVTKSLSAGGFQDPTSESAKAAKLLVDKFGQGDMQLIISVTSDGGAQSAESRAVGTDIVAQLQASPHVADVTSAWTAPPTAAPALVSKDGKTGLIVAGITGGESDAQKYTKELTERLVHDRDGVTVRAGGEAMIYVQINGQTEKDLLLMESIAIPLSFLVLVWVFGGLLAAALPLAVGALRDPRVDGGAARDHLRHRRVDIRAESERRDGAGARHRLHAADRQPVSRRTRRRVGARRGADPHHGHRRADRAVLGDDGRAVDGRDGAVPDVLPEVVRLRGHRGGGVRGRRRDRGGARGDRAARRPAGLAGRAPAAPARCSGGPSRRPSPSSRHFWYRSTKFVMRRSIPIGLAIVALLLAARRAVPRRQVGLPRRPRAARSRCRRARSATRCATTSPSTRRATSTVVIPDAAGITPAGPRPLRRRALPGSRRVVGVVAGRNVRRRSTGRAALGRNGFEGRQRVPDRRQQRAAVLRRVRGSTRPVARGEHSRGQAGAADRRRADQQGQLDAASPNGFRSCSR